MTLPTDDEQLAKQAKELSAPVMRLITAIVEKHHRAIISELHAQVDTIMTERRELVQALEDLSFECDGVTCVRAPSRETYNRTFAVLRKMRDGITIKVPA